MGEATLPVVNGNFVRCDGRRIPAGCAGEFRRGLELGRSSPTAAFERIRRVGIGARVLEKWKGDRNRSLEIHGWIWMPLYSARLSKQVVCGRR